MTLSYFNCEISNGASWVDLNDTIHYKVAGGETRGDSAVQWRRVMATNPVLEGQYQVHAVRDQVTEAVNLYVYSGSQAELQANIIQLQTLFSQFSYQIRFTFDSVTETWNCFTADWSLNRNAVYTHSSMATFSAQVPRLPDVIYGTV